MRIGVLKLLYVVVFCLAFVSNNGIAQINGDKHILVAMRTIGHELMLDANDSTSLVLPIEQVDNEYKIQFDKEFTFEPRQLVATVLDVMEIAEITNSYIIQVEECVSKDIVYSCEVTDGFDHDYLPCARRGIPVGCYSVLITIFESENPIIVEEVVQSESSFLPYIFGFLLVGFVVVYLVKRNRKKEIAQSHLIKVGKYLFDKRNMELSLNGNKIELTSKEANLLFLLHDSANNTLEREVILKTVWGDEGDYVGRTLDVFISKLRKKLVEDSRIKIVNIRGVGYKLILDV